MTGTPLSAVVEKTRTQAALGSLRAEGVYDDSRSIYECGSETVAIPVTDPPQETDVLDVIEQAGETRERGLDDHLARAGWSAAEIERAPGSWAVIGSVILVDTTDCPRPAELGEALLAMHGNADTVLARGGISGEHREPGGEVIAGEGDTETVHREHGTTYALDLSEVMFSPGNKAERARMGEVVEAGERVLDMFAGIGYFTLPMARSGAAVTAVERNPASFAYLVENVVRNGVQESVETYRADCRDVVAGGIEGDDAFEFDRVVMGYYDAYEYLDSALAALSAGGTVHMHEATPDTLVPDRPVERLESAAAEAGRSVDVLDTRTVKGYSEGVSHVVVDARVE
ncbi:MAG: class I SAM-dependent methyltransferase [Natrialbaceae archaeon]